MRQAQARILLCGAGFIATLLTILFLVLRPSPEETELREALTQFYIAATQTAGGPTPMERARARDKVNAGHIPLLIKWLTEPYRTAVTDRVRFWLNERFPTVVARHSSGSSDLKLDPNTLAMTGFEVLGTNGVSAVPELRRLARREYRRTAVEAMVHIGEPGWECGVDLLNSEKPEERRLGAFLLGALAVHPERSAKILLPFLRDPDESVRSEVRTALAEFPGEVAEPIFAGMLKGPGNPLDAIDGAYGLHGAGTNALSHFFEAWVLNSNRPVRSAVLGGIAFQEEWERIKANSESRLGIYRGKRSIFGNKVLSMAWFMYADKNAESVMDQVKSNVVSGGTPQVEALIKARKQSRDTYTRSQ